MAHPMVPYLRHVFFVSFVKRSCFVLPRSLGLFLTCSPYLCLSWDFGRAYLCLRHVLGLTLCLQNGLSFDQWFWLLRRGAPLPNGRTSFLRSFFTFNPLTIRVFNPLRSGLCFLSSRPKLPTPWSYVKSPRLDYQ